MRRLGLVVIALAAVAAAQTAPTGLMNTGSYATVVGPVSPPLLVTPTANFTLVSSSPVGATNGTSNNQVGATSMTQANVPLPSVQSAVELTSPGAGTSSLLGRAIFAELPPLPSRGSGADAGAAQFGFTLFGGSTDRRSLGEIAQVWKAHRGAQATRVFTNADVSRLRQAPPGSSIGPKDAPAEKPNPQLPQRP